MSYNLKLLILYCGYLFTLSLISFILFCIDKSLAKKEKRRIKEKTLLFFVSLGGGIGGYFGRIISHHKVKKIYFSLIINLTMVLQLLLLGAMITFVIIGG